MDELTPLTLRVQYLEAALRDISQGNGPFSRDPLEHAGNCIDNMATVASLALNGEWKPDA